MTLLLGPSSLDKGLAPARAGAPLSHTPQLFEIGSCRVVRPQTCHPPSSASQIAETVDMSHCTSLFFFFKEAVYLYLKKFFFSC